MKKIRSHYARVKAAQRISDLQGYEASIFNGGIEAITEFLLLEDIYELCKKRKEYFDKQVTYTRSGIKSKELNMAQYGALADLFHNAVEVARDAIINEKFKSLAKAIHERALMKATRDMNRDLAQLRKMSVELLRKLSDETIEALKEQGALYEDLDDLDAHEENVRKIMGTQGINLEEIKIGDTNLAEINKVIDAAEAVIPDKKEQDQRRPSKLETNNE